MRFIQVCLVSPAHQVEAPIRPQESIDEGVAQTPSSRAGVKLMGGHSVEHIKHTTMRHNGNLFAKVLGGQAVDDTHNSRSEHL